ncbi:MAG: hypothetical protein LVT47_07270 [Cyanobacteria bacterium LVE1205-1]
MIESTGAAIALPLHSSAVININYLVFSRPYLSKPYQQSTVIPQGLN